MRLPQVSNPEQDNRVESHAVNQAYRGAVAINEFRKNGCCDEFDPCEYAES
jgi:hypothetical protein